uniref:NADH dehydrogenase subunit 2 n=1 Tax=Bathytyphlops marionae TaxID=1916735 RepID=UPI0028FC93DF|nr:NADH dehydrogenase subunit 2 [Bathytyphlops marionae]WNH38043.1 NADH dehydrogenase subunit 2 [Bathytyphlops marionae]
MGPYIVAIFGLTLGLGTIITFASSHWLIAWIGLELTSLAMLPLIAQYNHPRAAEACVKYYLTQAAGAAMILFAAICNALYMGEWSIHHYSHPFATTLLVFALALKLGIAPVHLWVPDVLQGVDLITGLIMSTWQKLAPFVLIIQLTTAEPALLTALGIASILVGGWGGLNQTQLRKILAYSSTAHLGWMILVLQFAPLLTWFALLLYIITTSSLFMAFHIYRPLTLTALRTAWAKSPILATLVPILFLSLAGLPPLTGFMPKWLILQELTSQGFPITATFAALSALLSLFFYCRVGYSLFMIIPPNIVGSHARWRIPNMPYTLSISFLIVSALVLIPLLPTFIYYLIH